MSRLLNPRLIGLPVAAFGLALLASNAFAFSVPNITMESVSTWGWLFSAVGLAMTHLKLPAHWGRIWALATLAGIAYIMAILTGIIQ